MGELTKPWNNGGSLSVTFDGDGDGSAIFTSTENIGDAREMDVSFVDKYRKVVVVRTVRQAARPSVETYTPLTYIECTGEQYINLGYVVQEDDIIEMKYISTSNASSDKMLFGSYDSDGGYVWFSLYSNTAYVRFGTTSSVSVTNARMKYNLTMKKGSCTVDDTTVSPSFSKLSSNPLFLFARCSSSLTAALFAYCKAMSFSIKKASGDVVMRLSPCKRDSDGKVGMLDAVSGRFFANEGSGADFVAGSEVNIPQGYELLEYVTFSKNKLYELGIVNSTDRLEVMFERSETSTTPYLYGCVTSPHTASVSAYLSSGGAWRFGSSYKGISMNDKRIHRVEVYNGTVMYDFTTGTFTKSTFTTPDTVVLGGYRAASGSTTKNYQGKVYYYRIFNHSTNELRLDWYPCKNAEGVEGFWDCINQKFVEPIN